MSLTEIAERDPLAATVLDVAACLHPDRIPVGLLSGLAGGDDLAIDDALTLATSFTMPICGARAATPARSPCWTMPPGWPSGLSARTGCPTLEARANLAIALWSSGRFRDALEISLQTLHARERRLGPRHPDTLHTMHNLAAALREDGGGAGIGLATGATLLAGPAFAIDPNSCGRGLNTANTGWGTCTGSGDWRVVTWCYATGSTNSGWWSWSDGGTHTQYSSCPSWSHVTKVVVEAR